MDWWKETNSYYHCHIFGHGPELTEKTRVNFSKTANLLKFVCFSDIVEDKFNAPEP